MSKKNAGPFFFILLIALIAGLFYLNRWIQSKVGDIIKNPIQEIPVQPVKAEDTGNTVARRRLTGEVLKKTRTAPDRSFELSIFYQGGEEIASQRVSPKGEIYEQTGVIPDGKVKFVNETNETYGAEIYKDGKRHGPMKVYYKDGVLMQESSYLFGRLMTSKEYYHNGVVRMEVDFSDARKYDDGRDVGIGKVYSQDGRVKYEWKLINTDPVGYQKSYNRQGTLTGEVYFDGNGDIIPPKAPPAAPEPSSASAI